MQSDFSVLPAHLAEASRLRKMAHEPRFSAAIDLHFAGVRALNVYRLAQIADQFDVSVDWLLGRSDMMELLKAKANRASLSLCATPFASSEEAQNKSNWKAAYQ